jgi:predicted ATP-dependent Lon-type protease
VHICSYQSRVDYIAELSIGSMIKESDLIEQVFSLGHTHNHDDIDRVTLESNGLIKKTFIEEPGRT